MCPVVCVDGPNGAGKSSLLRALTEALGARGLQPEMTAEPTDTELGAFIRREHATMTGVPLACLVAADRHAHAERMLTRSADGALVLCDRHIASSLVLDQIDGVPLSFLLELYGPLPRPELLILLDADPVLLDARLSARGRASRYEQRLEQSVDEARRYREIVPVLERIGFEVLVLPVGHDTPDVLAASVRAELERRSIIPPSSD